MLYYIIILYQKNNVKIKKNDTLKKFDFLNELLLGISIE